MAKAPIQNMSDGEGRKLGERTGLDRLFDICLSKVKNPGKRHEVKLICQRTLNTPVVPAVNDADCGVTHE